MAAKLAETYDRIILWEFMALVFLVPLVMSPYNYANFEPIKMAIFRIISLILLATWLAKTIETKELSLRSSPLDLSILAFLFFAFISTLTSVHLHTSIWGELYRYEGLMTLLNYGLVYYLALNFVKERKDFEQVMSALLLAAIPISLYAILQHFGYDFISWDPTRMPLNRSFSTFGNPVFLGAYLTLILPLALVLFIQKENPFLKVLAGVNLPLLLSTLVFSYTRAAWVGTLVALVLIAFLGRKFLVNKRLFLSLSLIALMALLFVIVPVKKIAPERPPLTVAKRLKETTKVEEGTVGTRLSLWKISLKMVKERPFLGSGPDTFKLVFPQFKPENWREILKEKGRPDKAHNELVQILTTQGVLGLTAYLIILLIFFWKTSLNLRASPSSHLLSIGFLACIIGYLIQLQFSFSLFSFAFLFWLILGVSLNLGGTQEKRVVFEEKGTFHPLFKFGLYSVLIFGVVFFSFMALRPFLADLHIQRGVREMKLSNFEGASLEFKKATALNPKEAQYQIFLGQAAKSKFLKTGSLVWFNQAEKAYLEAQKINPREKTTSTYLASLYLETSPNKNQNFLARAILNFEKALELDPQDDVIRFNLGYALAQQGHFDKAIKEWNKAITINPKLPAAYYNLGRAYELKKEFEKAKIWYRKTLQINPKYSPAKKALKRLGG